MKTAFDYHSFDKMEIAVKTNKEKRLIKDYALFGFTVVDRYADKIYSDVAHVTFTRPHKIPNKDKLQLMQIYYENYINDESELEKNKHTKSGTFAASAFLSGQMKITVDGKMFVLVIFIFATPIIINVIGYVLAALSVAVVVLMLTRIRKLVRKENEDFKFKTDAVKRNINFVLNLAKELTGDANDR